MGVPVHDRVGCLAGTKLAHAAAEAESRHWSWQPATLAVAMAMKRSMSCGVCRAPPGCRLQVVWAPGPSLHAHAAVLWRSFYLVPTKPGICIHVTQEKAGTDVHIRALTRVRSSMMGSNIYHECDLLMRDVHEPVCLR